MSERLSDEDLRGLREALMQATFNGGLTQDQASRVYAAVSESLATAERVGWRPIESAPKDGTPVLLWWDMGAFYGVVARWPREGHQWQVSWSATAIDRHYPYKPTHWMPLLEPPASHPQDLT